MKAISTRICKLVVGAGITETEESRRERLVTTTLLNDSAYTGSSHRISASWCGPAIFRPRRKLPLAL
jgi:hypothetical protein